MFFIALRMGVSFTLFGSGSGVGFVVQGVWASNSGLFTTFLLPSQAMTEIKLKGHKSSIQPKLNSYCFYCNCS